MTSKSPSPLDNAQQVPLAHQRLGEAAALAGTDHSHVREVLATKLIAVPEIRREHDKKYKELFFGARSVEAHLVRCLAISNTVEDVHALYDHRLDGEVVVTVERSTKPFEPQSQYVKCLHHIGASAALAHACDPPQPKKKQAQQQHERHHHNNSTTVASRCRRPPRVLTQRWICGTT
jgi:hypothetical protein